MRGGGVEDLGIVNGLSAAAFDPRFGEAWTPSQCAGMFALPGVWLTIAQEGERALGFAMARVILDDAELLLLAVDPSARRRGTGRALVRSTMAEAVIRGAVNLHLEVRAGNPAVSLYVGEGFTKIGERRKYYRGLDGEQFDAQTFRRSLSQE
nr:GNAT family N-acetyltransferase [Stakelama flava]